MGHGVQPVATLAVIITTVITSYRGFTDQRVLERYMFQVEGILGYRQNHSILGEESGKHAGNDYCWIIDPIDGTNSFVHNQPFYSTSIALAKNDETLLGAVYGPVLDELFIAELGQGATLNDQPIKVSTSDQLINSMFGTGFACMRTNQKPNNIDIIFFAFDQIPVRNALSLAFDTRSP